MIKLEDILDDAIRYLRGEMDAEERSFFEELLERHPHLKEELRFTKLVREGLKEMEVSPQELTAKNTWLPKNIWILALCLFLIGSLLAYFLVFQNSTNTAAESEQNTSVIYANQMEDNTYLKIVHGGGDGSAIDPDRGLSVRWIGRDDIIFSGTFAGTGSLGDQGFSSEGKRDMLFGSYNLETGFRWIIPIGGTETNDVAQDITMDSNNNVIVTGGFGSQANFGNQILHTRGTDNEGNHDFFIAKYSSNGKLQWVGHGGGKWVADQQTGVNTGLAVAIDNKDDIIVSGSYIGSILLGGQKLPIGGPNEDLFLAKYAPDGTIRWVESITCDYMIYGFELGTDFDENIYLAGAFGHHNLGGRAYFGRDTLTSFGGKDVFLAKYSSEGKLIWVRQAGSSLKEQGYDMSTGLAVDEEGNAVITGVFAGQAVFGSDTLPGYGGRDIFLAKYNTNGQVLWARQAGSPQGSGSRNEGSHAVALDKNGHIFLTGSFTGSALFDDKIISTGNTSNFFIAKYTPKGQLLWVDQFEGLEDFQGAAGFSIDVNDVGNVVVTGFFSGTIRIGGKTLRSQGNGDIFILLFNEEGKLLSAGSMVAYL